MTQNVWLLDAPIYVFRAWFGMPDRWHDSEGRPLNAVIGFTNTLLTLLEKVSPMEPFIATFDESLGTNFRNDIYIDYKKSRVQPDPALLFQFESCKLVLGVLGVPCFFGARYEADDYISSLSKVYHDAGYKITIVTRDKDLCQLIIDKDIVCFDPVSGQTTDETVFKNKTGLLPFQIIDFLALTGDAIDDVPGIAGIGKKTAISLLASYGSLDGIKAHLDKDGEFSVRGKDRVAQLIRDQWDKAILSRQLVRLFDCIPGIKVDPLPIRSSINFIELEHMLSGWKAPNNLLIRCKKLAEKIA